MANKVLFCATVDYHFQKFHLPYMQWFKEQGWEVHVAAKGELELPYVDRKFDISMQRSPLRLKNMQAYRELKKIIAENDYRLIHCHTPMGGALARLAARRARTEGTHVLYTAHGFHFCKGAPLLNWLLYYPMEKWLSRYTDCLITINREDYTLANDRRFSARAIEWVRGVGVDLRTYLPATQDRKRELRRRYGYRETDFLLFYAAEFNRNKNQRSLIRAVALLKDDIPGARLLLAGEGPELAACVKLAAELGVGRRVDFLGYRNDIGDLLPMCDLAVASSLREGLPVNIVEAMACGLPVVASRNRGHAELIADTANGYIVPPSDANAFSEKIKKLYRSKELLEQIGRTNRVKAGMYSLERVRSEMTGIYSQYAAEVRDEAEGQYRRAYL